MKKRKINAKIVADSINPQGNRITTFLLTYPRFIHGELMTHRMFSRNSASSRAIPFEKMVKMVEEGPFIPIAWQRDHKGMQGTEYLNEEEVERAELQWIQASKNAINSARMLNSNYFGVTKNLVTKQLCNRLLEPFMWHTVLVTATEWENFFELRCPKYKLFGLGSGPQKSRKDWLRHMQFSSSLHPLQYPKTEEEWWSISESGAEIHIQALAESMWDAKNESTPNILKAGEWHIPFGDKILEEELIKLSTWKDEYGDIPGPFFREFDAEKITNSLKIATARCARLSYMTFDNEIDYQKDIELHNILLKSRHASPFEHCARAMSDHEYKYFIKGQLIDCESDGDWQEDGRWEDVFIENKNTGWCNNFKGFIPYRYLVEYVN